MPRRISTAAEIAAHSNAAEATAATDEAAIEIWRRRLIALEAQEPQPSEEMKALRTKAALHLNELTETERALYEDNLINTMLALGTRTEADRALERRCTEAEAANRRRWRYRSN